MSSFWPCYYSWWFRFLKQPFENILQTSCSEKVCKIHRKTPVPESQAGDFRLESLRATASAFWRNNNPKWYKKVLHKNKYTYTYNIHTYIYIYYIYRKRAKLWPSFPLGVIHFKEGVLFLLCVPPHLWTTNIFFPSYIKLLNNWTIV